MSDILDLTRAHYERMRIQKLEIPEWSGEDGKPAVALLPDPGPGGKVDTDLEGRDDEADEATVFAGVQGAGGCPAFAPGSDAYWGSG